MNDLQTTTPGYAEGARTDRAGTRGRAMTRPADRQQQAQPSEPASTDRTFVYQFFSQAEAPDTWTADAAYPADSPVPYTLTPRPKPCWRRLAPRRTRRPSCQKRTLVIPEPALRMPGPASPAHLPTSPRSPCRRETAASTGSTGTCWSPSPRVRSLPGHWPLRERYPVSIHSSLR